MDLQEQSHYTTADSSPSQDGVHCGGPCYNSYGAVIEFPLSFQVPTLRIANGAGFLGDWLDAPRRLVERAEVDYLTIEHLAELTMSILARLREKDPSAGYAEDFLDILRSLTPALQQQPQLKIVANSGGMNPPACVRGRREDPGRGGPGRHADRLRHRRRSAAAA